MNGSLILLPFSLFVLIFANACGKDNAFVPTCDSSTPTNDAGIRTIINDNCISAPCHGISSANGDWTSYDGMNTVINNGKFDKQVLTYMTMPKGSATLTEAQMNLIRCWVDNDYPEN